MKLLSQNLYWAVFVILGIAVANLAAQSSAAADVSHPGEIGARIDLMPTEKGAKIAHVYSGGPADLAGLRKGDLIVAINGAEMSNVFEFVDRLGEFSPGTNLTIDYQRAGERKKAVVTLREHRNVFSKEALLPLAEKGDAAAQFDLAEGYFYGLIYEQGKLIPEDDAQATLWYERSAKRGYAEAENMMGILHRMGRGFPADVKQAANWFSKSAEHGNSDAQLNLGRLYIGMRVGGAFSWCSQSFKWFSKAAEQGDVDAEELLADSYSAGCGTKKNSERAAYWKQKASQQKNAAAEAKAAVTWKHFHNEAAAWRALVQKPEIPEEVRRERVLAEGYLSEKNLKGAVEHYEKGVSLCSTWSQGWYNLALLYGETGDYKIAVDRMKHYLELMPDSADATAARDRMILWEDKAIQQK